MMWITLQVDTLKKPKNQLIRHQPAVPGAQQKAEDASDSDKYTPGSIYEIEADMASI